MNKKGLFSFIIVLAITLILLEFFIGLQETTNSFEKTKNELIKIEKAHLERTVIEQNVDRIVLEKLSKQLEKKNTNSLIVQREINNSLNHYLSGKARATSIFSEHEEKLTIEYLNKNSILIILEFDNKFFSEYVFTSDITRTEKVSGKMGNKMKTEFEIPFNYTIRVIR